MALDFAAGCIGGKCSEVRDRNYTQQWSEWGHLVISHFSYNAGKSNDVNTLSVLAFY